MKSIISTLPIEFDCPVIMLTNGAFDWEYNKELGLHAIIHAVQLSMAFEFDDDSMGRSVIYFNKEEHGDDETFITVVVFSKLGTDEAFYSQFFFTIDSDAVLKTVQMEDETTGEILFVSEDNPSLTGMMTLLVKIDGILDMLNCSDVRLKEADPIHNVFSVALTSLCDDTRKYATRRMSAGNGKFLKSAMRNVEDDML